MKTGCVLSIISQISANGFKQSICKKIKKSFVIVDNEILPWNDQW